MLVLACCVLILTLRVWQWPKEPYVIVFVIFFKFQKLFCLFFQTFFGTVFLEFPTLAYKQDLTFHNGGDIAFFLCILFNTTDIFSLFLYSYIPGIISC